MKNLKSIYRKFFLLVLCTGAGTVSFAQKLPAVQKDGVIAPQNVKTDGKPTEWAQFAAYNKANAFFYTIANSKDKLYLTIQTTDLLIIKKILGGGITLAINIGDKKTTPVTVTYPLIPGPGQEGIIPKLNDAATNMNTELPNINTQLANNSKQIIIKGVKDITDTLISVYNDLGISAALQIDKKKALTCELAIPLRYLGLSDNQKTLLNYNIKLNGVNEPVSNVRINGHPVDSNSPEVIALINRVRAQQAAQGNSIGFSTDFSGTYSLAEM